MVRESFGTRLRRLRELAGMNQTQLADRIGADQRSVSRWECNVAEPGVRMADTIATVLGVSLPDLLGISHGTETK